MQKIHHLLKTLVSKLKNIKLTTPVAILIGALIISLGIISYGFIVNINNQPQNTALFSGKPIDNSDYVEGNTKSKILVVMYSDPECPFCVSVYPTIKQIRNEYEDRVAFVYRHFPLTQLHSHAFDESRAIACAGTIGGNKKYYEYIDTLYSYKSDHKTTQLSVTGKEEIARNIGLDIPTFISCMNTNQTAQIIDESINDGVQAGVQGTPSTFILVKNRKGYEVISMVDGARPYSYFKSAIEEALSK